MAESILILGASSDIGCALLEQITGRYRRIYAHCLYGGERLNGMAAKHNLPLSLLRADLTDPAAIDRMIEGLREEQTVPDDIVYLPAGPFSYCQFKKLRLARFQEGMAMTVYPAAQILQAFLPEMARRGSGHVVVMLSSVTIGTPPLYLADYTTSKYALLGLVRSLAAEYEDKGLRISGIS
ncbi:MAG: SDR family oxidoreductase, partial [Lachnospiraceae bacterium]|nr:SDR family oxidoreductase [Lachnospiraceae bacterium]